MDNRSLTINLIILLFVVILFTFIDCSTHKGHKKEHHKSAKKTSVQKHVHHSSSSKSLEHSMPWKEIPISKKSLVEHPQTAMSIKKNEIEHKQKRGFLANLANLLTDAEKISGHKNAEETSSENGLSSYTLTPRKNLVEVLSAEGNSNNNNNHQQENLSVSSNDNINAKKESIVGESDITASTKEIDEAVAESGKDFAPVFAMYHGKVVTLGKLPDTAFKRSHLTTEEQSAHQSNTNLNVEIPRDIHVDKPDKHQMKDVTGSKRFFDENIEKPQLKPEKRDSQIDAGAKLHDYLKTLDSVKTKDTRGVVKDEVPSPLDTTGTLRSDLVGHIKGVVLDDGKVVSLANNHMQSEDTSTAPVRQQHSELPDAQQKYYVTNDGNVEPLVKSKTEDVDAVTRDTLMDNLGSLGGGGGGGQKTVTLTVDVLKDLLKRTDSKVSLASLLNKPAETRSDTPQEDEDPGTIEDFAAGGLKSHNVYRAKHHDDALVWSDDLAAKAQKLAEALADKKTLEIAKDLEKDGMGENVAKVWATFKNAGDAATKMWYSQSSNYRFDDPHLDENTGQFAQVIWKSTRELGMGVAKSIDDVNNKYVYVTALYRPPGNIEATLRDNVLPTGNNTVDVYSTFFKRTGVLSKDNHNSRRSKIQRHNIKKKKTKSKHDDDN